MVRPLKKLDSCISVTKSLQGSNKVREFVVCRCDRGFHVIAVQKYDQMDVIWHDNIFVYMQTTDLFRGKNVLLHNLTNGG